VADAGTLDGPAAQEYVPIGGEGWSYGVVVDPRLGLRGAIANIRNLKSIQNIKGLFGKKYPTKPNSAGQQQPYDPNTGRYLSPEANPGLVYSPAGRFSGGFSQGMAEGYSGVQGATPVGAAGRTGHFFGYIIGSIGSIF
jgi:hypothetical protein